MSNWKTDISNYLIDNVTLLLAMKDGKLIVSLNLLEEDGKAIEISSSSIPLHDLGIGNHNDT